MPESHTFIVQFELPGVTAADDVATRVYEDERLQDFALMGPDDYGVFDGEFDRETSSFAAAIGSALRDLQAVLPEARIRRVSHDDVVSLAAIARRVGRSHESVRLLARGQRGPGGFPAPLGRIDERTEVWRWPEVALWFERPLGAPAGDTADDLLLTMVNDALELRHAAHLCRLDSDGLRAVASLLPPELLAAAA